MFCIYFDLLHNLSSSCALELPCNIDEVASLIESTEAGELVLRPTRVYLQVFPHVFIIMLVQASLFRNGSSKVVSFTGALF